MGNGDSECCNDFEMCLGEREGKVPPGLNGRVEAGMFWGRGWC